jgi:hypothetical protein
MSTSHGHNGVHHATDEAIDALYAWMPSLQAPQACPEALFSVTLKGTIGGHEALLTARGQTAAEFKANIDAIRGLLDAPQASQAPVPTQGQEGWCPVHQVQMQWNKGKNGDKGWYSHKVDGQWCKGR